MPMPLLIKPAHDFLDFRDRDRIDSGKRLVEQQKKRRKHQRPGDLHSAAFAAGKREGLVRRQMVDAEHLHQRIGPFLLAP